MQEAVLLRQLVVEGQLDFDRALLDKCQFGSDRAHRRLPREALANALSEIGGITVVHQFMGLCVGRHHYDRGTVARS